jgi:putative ABC transport system permease protein
VFLVGVGLLLLIACANVANLFLSRGVSRERELAVRTALGAAPARLIRQLLTETVVIAMLGGVLAVALALIVVRILPRMAPADFPRLDAVRLDWTVLAFASCVSLAVGLLSGLVPALRGARPDLLPALRDGAGASTGRRATRLRRALLGAEASLAVMLLVAALLVGRSFLRLLDVDPGYNPKGVLTARVYLPGAARGQAQTDAFVASLLQRLRAVSGVEAAGAGSMAPFSLSTAATALTITAGGRGPAAARSLPPHPPPAP